MRVVCPTYAVEEAGFFDWDAFGYKSRLTLYDGVAECERTKGGADHHGRRRRLFIQ